MTPHAATAPFSGLLVRRSVERRSVVVAAAVVLLAALLATTWGGEATTAQIGMLAVVPVMLLGLELGVVGGLSAAAPAAGLLAAGHAGQGLAGTVVTALGVLAAGAIAGRFSDRMRHAGARQKRLLRSAFALGGAIADAELPAVVAHAATRIPGIEGARVVIDGMPAAAAGRMTAARASVPVQATGRTLGTIEIAVSGELDPEERAALELLGAQAALAADNRRLAALDRERAVVEAELARLREELTEHRSGVESLLSVQEDERSRIADRLHEDLAQILSAVLLGLRMLDREPAERRATTVEEVRGQISDVLRDLRDVARSLRPGTLTHLGLRPALEALAAEGRIELRAAELTAALPAPVETSLYRIVQDSIAASGGHGRLAVELATEPHAVELRLSFPDGPSREAVWPAIRARVEAIAGDATLHAPDVARIVVPVRSAVAANESS